MTFEERSVVFQPALGSEAPRAHTMAIATQHIRRGDQWLLMGDDATPKRSHTNTSVTYAWPNVDEQFTTRTDGLKHSFVFAHRPAGDGDLIVQLAIDTTLHSDESGSLWFDRDEYGLTIGDVVGIDANGKRCMGAKRLHDGGLELRLPASFVDSAQYPLELDPLISTAVDGLAGYDIDFPDVAYDAASDCYCVVWTQFLGGGQTGVVEGAPGQICELSLGYPAAN